MARIHGRVALLWLVVLSGACARSNEVRCADGRLCPPGTTCDDVNSRCLSPAQLSACEGLAEGSPCTITGAPGACRAGACDPLVCGDGVRSLSEACDGDDLGGATCVTAGFYEPAGLACSAFCTFDVSACVGRCGDGVVNGSELCDGAAPPGACYDFGFDAGAVSCGPACGIAFDACARFGWVSEATTLELAYGFAATAADDIWVAGQVGAQHRVAHFDGTGWTTESLSGDGPLISIATAAAGDVWLVRDTTPSTSAALLRRTASGWSPAGAPVAEYRDVWAASATAVFVATTDAGVLWWNGSTWATLGTLAGASDKVRGTGPSNVWVVRPDKTVERWNGVAWTPMAVGFDVLDLVVLAPDVVWAVGATSAGDAASAQWDGVAWTLHVEPGEPQWFATTASAANDLWVATTYSTRRFDGVRWSTHGTTDGVGVFGGFSSMRHLGDVILAHSFDGFLYRYRHQAYAELDRSGFATVTAWSKSPYETVAIDGSRNAYHFDGTAWTTRVVDAEVPAQALKAIAGTSPTDLWAGSTGGRVFHFDGATWNLVTVLSYSVVALLPFSSSEVWSITESAVYRFDGTSFQSEVASPTQFVTAAASGPADIWAVARLLGSGQSDVWRHDGVQWTMTTIPYEVVRLSVIAPDRAFAIARPNIVLTFDGSSWTPTPLPSNQPLLAISAVATDDVFASSRNQLFHFDGAGWRRVRLPGDVITTGRDIVHIAATPYQLDVYFSGSVPAPMRRLIRTRPWDCKATETACSDGVDNDCDGTHDALDADCP